VSCAGDLKKAFMLILLGMQAVHSEISCVLKISCVLNKEKFKQSGLISVYLHH